MKKPKKKIKLIQIDRKTWIEIAVERDSEKAKAQFIEKQSQNTTYGFMLKKDEL